MKVVIHPQGKDAALEAHMELLPTIQNSRHDLLLYADGACREGNAGCAVTAIWGTQSRDTWRFNLGQHMGPLDAELYALEKAANMAWQHVTAHPETENVWVFSDCQNAIRQLTRAPSGPGQHLVASSHQSIQRCLLFERNITFYIQWIPGH